MLLLDTHVVYWWLVEPHHVGTDLRVLLLDAPTRVFVSHVSLWELVVKRAAGKLRLDLTRFAEIVEATGFEWLPISAEHLFEADQLPVHPDHRDPFDRLLVAQASANGLRLVTADRALAVYGDMVHPLG